MTDRLPRAMVDPGRETATERASATPIFRRAGALGTRAATAIPTEHIPEHLADLEKWMLGAIIGKEPAEKVVDAVLTPGPRLSAYARFDVYRAGYRARLVECLADDYPVLEAACGADRFEALCQAYIDEHPSRSPNLNAFGRHMPAFLACYSVPDLPGRFSSNLAALEWAVVESIHAGAPEPFDFQALRSVPIEAWATARLHRSETVRMLSFDYPVNRYFQAMREGKSPAIPEPLGTATAVYRRGFVVWRMDLTPAMAKVLEALLGGAAIGDALSQLAVDGSDREAVAEAERTVMHWFREWVEAGFFSGVTLAPG